MQYSVVLFHSITGALQAEKRLKGKGIANKLIPVPRQLSSDCGVCLRFQREDEAEVKKALEEDRLDTQGIYPI
jgi:Putative Se/S carrier protein-like